ncbi:MAG: hypothetical protein U5J98_05955 [Halobacteriales archaeon]|nr:hypothetical protein [Halobacteriales archaeon]
MRRRTLLAGAGLAVTAGLAGCAAAVDPDSDDQTIQATTPAAGACDPDPSLRPTPDSSRAKSYPTLPSSATADAAESFARAHERAYRYNARLATHGSIQVELEVPDWAGSETGDGYLVGLEGRVQFDEPKTPDGDATQRPSGFLEYSVWYLVTERFALRGGETDREFEQGRDVDLADAQPVACEDDS